MVLNGVLKQQLDITIKKKLIANVKETYNNIRSQRSNQMLIQTQAEKKLKKKQYKSKKLNNAIIAQL
ncbi:MAG: putative transposase [Clostridium sp.]|jgi:hypothetical protein